MGSVWMLEDGITLNIISLLKFATFSNFWPDFEKNFAMQIIAHMASCKIIAYMATSNVYFPPAEEQQQVW